MGKEDNKDMTIQALKDYIEIGNEIEFKYNGKKYSITYGIFEDQEMLSFCEFFQETTEVSTFEDLLKVSRDGVSVLQMWEALTEDDVWIY